MRRPRRVQARSVTIRHRQSIARRRGQAARRATMNRSAKLIVAAAVAFLGASATGALAESAWDYNHPRRDQVNDRLENQDRRINHQAREGEIGPWRAWRLHQEDPPIRPHEP